MAKGSISELTDPRQREQEELRPGGHSQGPGLGTQKPHPASPSTAPQAAAASHAPCGTAPAGGARQSEPTASSAGQSGSVPSPAHAQLFNRGDKTFTKAHSTINPSGSGLAGPA